MDFSIHSKTKFKAGIDYYSRVYVVQELRNGKVQIRHMLTADVIYVLALSEITLNGQPMQSLDDLQEILFSRHCYCDPSEPDQDPEPFKIFDLSFDQTFE